MIIEIGTTVLLSQTSHDFSEESSRSLGVFPRKVVSILLRTCFLVPEIIRTTKHLLFDTNDH